MFIIIVLTVIIVMSVVRSINIVMVIIILISDIIVIIIAGNSTRILTAAPNRLATLYYSWTSRHPCPSRPVSRRIDRPKLPQSLVRSPLKESENRSALSFAKDFK